MATIPIKPPSILTRLTGPLRRHPPLAAVLAAFILLAAIYSIVNPLYEGTDELRHFRFVRVLADTGKLPIQGQEPKRSQSHHPPLYYAVSAIATFWIPYQGEPYLARPGNPYWGFQYWQVGTDNKNMYLHGPDEDFPWSGAALSAHVARLVNVLFGALTVVFTAAIMLTVFPHRPGLAYGAAGVLAFNPMFLYMSGAINNDVAAAAAGAAVTWACCRLVLDGLNDRASIALGIGFGLSLMAKFNLAFFLPVIELVVLYRTLCPVPHPTEDRPQKRPAAFLRANLIILGLSAVIAGWWFVRNQVLYGDPTGFNAVTELWGVRDPLESFGLAWSEIPNAWSSLWGRFGYGQIPLPGWVYRIIEWAAVLGVAGSVLGIIQAAAGKKPKNETVAATQLLLLFLIVVSTFGVLFSYMLVSPAGSMGRFFFPGLPAFAGLLFYGWTALAGFIPLRPAVRSRRIHLYAITTIMMAAFAIWALTQYLAPAYARPKAIDPDSITDKLRVTLSDSDGPLARLLDYRVDKETLLPGETLDVTLTWQTVRAAGQQYVIFIHLLDENGSVAAQRDTYHGLGNYPTGFWQPGHTFKETYSITLPETAYAPSALSLQVGLYSRDSVYRLETTPATPDNAVLLTSIRLEPLPGDLPNPQNVNFDNQIVLVGYSASSRAVRPGERIDFDLYWQAIQTPTKDYGIFLHLLGDENQIWANDDGRPSPHFDEWTLNTTVLEQRSLTLPEDISPGFYQVEVGVWPIGHSNKRLPIVAEDGHWIDDRLLLSPVRVLPSE